MIVRKRKKNSYYQKDNAALHVLKVGSNQRANAINVQRDAQTVQLLMDLILLDVVAVRKDL